MLVPASVNDFRTLARQRLPRQLFDYIDGGAYQEQTLADNSRAFERLKLRQRVLVDVSDIQFDCQLLDQSMAMPLILAPVGLAGSFRQRGELQALRAAEQAGVPFCLSSVSICSMEEVAPVATKPFWYQLYMMRDRQVVTSLINRAKAVGCDTLVMTVDLPFPGARYRDSRNGLSGNQSLPVRLRRLADLLGHPKWLVDVAIKGKPLVFGNLVDEVPQAKSMTDLQGWIASQFDPTVSWDDLAWVREQWPGKLLIKGLMDPEDARQAWMTGVDALIVSNHGGRQLDSVPATIDALPAVLDEIGGKIPVLVDGGIRSGLDLMKAIAMGASGGLIGRPWAFALAANGQAGVEQMLGIMADELRIAMALTGQQRLTDLSHDVFV